MKGLFNKLIVIAAGVVALFGMSAANVTSSVKDINGKSALYLVHGKQISSGVITLSDHASHASHDSHSSHASHSSSW